MTYPMKAWRKKNPRKAQAQATRANARASTRLQRILDPLKAKPCKDCGGKFPPECMDFDHVRGRKVDQLSHMKGRPLTSIMREVKKCDLVCANCHRIRTRRRRRK